MKRIPRSLVHLTLIALPLTAAADNKDHLWKKGREYAIEKGLLKGMVDVEILRDDIVEVTLDGAFIGDHTEAEGESGRKLSGLASDLQKPETFVISSETAPGFAEGVRPEKVFRNAYEGFNAKDAKGNWALAVGNLYHHDYYLNLPLPLVAGHK